MDNVLELELVFNSISRGEQNIRSGKELPNGGFSCRRPAKSAPTTVSLVLASMWRGRYRDSALDAFLSVTTNS